MRVCVSVCGWVCVGVCVHACVRMYVWCCEGCACEVRTQEGDGAGMLTWPQISLAYPNLASSEFFFQLRSTSILSEILKLKRFRNFGEYSFSHTHTLTLTPTATLTPPPPHLLQEQLPRRVIVVVAPRHPVFLQDVIKRPLRVQLPIDVPIPCEGLGTSF